MYDATEQLVLEAEESFAVLGKGEDFLFFDTADRCDKSALLTAVANGYAYSGVIGLKRGVPYVEMDPHPQSARAMVPAALAFCSKMAAQIVLATPGDAVGWLNALHNLTDLRPTI